MLNNYMYITMWRKSWTLFLSLYWKFKQLEGKDHHYTSKFSAAMCNQNGATYNLRRLTGNHGKTEEKQQ